MESPGKKFTDLVEIESIQDTDLTVVRNDTGVKKTPMQKLSDYIKQKFIGWVFSDLPTTDKTIPGAIKELNSALVFTPRYDNLVDGSSFNKDFLSIYLPAHENRLNAANYFSKPAADSGWSNIPTQLSGKLWLGYRAPQRMGGTNELVVIMEHFPVSGRIWTNYYNSGTWQGWKSITPE